jgi:hypothetical protein
MPATAANLRHRCHCTAAAPIGCCQAYENAWKQLAQAAKLPASAILDLRGNHDVFDTIRNSEQDKFAVHSAAAAAHGRQAAATQRLWLSQLPAQLLLPEQQQQHTKRRHHRGSAERRQLQQQLQHTVNAGSNSSSAVFAQGLRSRGRTALAAAAAHVKPAESSAAGGGGSACPAALLLGLDLAPNVGLHSPSNFFGVAGPALLQQLQQRLKQLRSSSSNGDPALPQGCSNVPIISYSHYPFSTVAAAYGSSSGVVDGGGEPAVEGGRALRDLLCRYNVSAHISGHLHDLLGPRMYVLYDSRQLMGGVFGRSKLRVPVLQKQGSEDAGSLAKRGATAGGAFMADLEVGSCTMLCLTSTSPALALACC